MNHAPPISPNAPEPDDLGWDLDVLRDLAETGMKLAQTFARKTQEAVEEAGLDPNSSADPGRPFTRMARCVRQTLALRAKILKDRRTPTTADTADRAQRAARARHRKRKALIRGAITDFIENTADRGDEERLLGDMNERLDDAELEEDFDTRPIGRIVIELCEALGVAVDLGLFDDEDMGTGKYAQDPPPPAPEPPPPPKPEAADPPASHHQAAAHKPAASRVRKPGEPDPKQRHLAEIDPFPD